MTREELAGYIDLTLLKPEAARGDFEAFLGSAAAHPYATVCVPPSRVGMATEALLTSPTGVSTVLGFPLGYQAPGVKLFEARSAIEDGATELDVVMNISAFRSGERAVVEEELKAICLISADVTVKVIIETCYLTDAEKLEALRIVIGSGAGFVKTSTGFGPFGAVERDVRLLAGSSKRRIKVKAAGGITDLNGALSMIRAGASRIGTSRGERIMEEFEAERG